MSPPMYANRQLYGTSTFMSATESVKLHGKLWVSESDLRTYLSEPDAGYGRTETPEASVATTWREFANVLTHHVGVTWYDMGGGWYAGEPMLKAFEGITRVAQEALIDREPFTADVALLVDEASFAHVRSDDLTRQLVGEVVAKMPTAGVTWDFYLLSDAGDPGLPAYRLYIVLNAVTMDEATRARLIDKARADGATILYQYAPSYAGAQTLDAGAIPRATGLTADMTGEGPAPYLLKAGTWLSQGLDATLPFGPANRINPRPVVDASEGQALATYADGAGVAVAESVVDGVTTVYCAAAAMPPELLRNVARKAGAHVYCETNDAFYTDGAYLALHAATDGEKAVDLGAERKVTDVVTGEDLGTMAQVRRQMKAGETVVLRLR